MVGGEGPAFDSGRIQGAAPYKEVDPGAWLTVLLVGGVARVHRASCLSYAAQLLAPAPTGLPPVVISIQLTDGLRELAQPGAGVDERSQGRDEVTARIHHVVASGILEPEYRDCDVTYCACTGLVLGEKLTQDSASLWGWLSDPAKRDAPIPDNCSALGKYGFGPCVLAPRHESGWHQQLDGKRWDEQDGPQLDVEPTAFLRTLADVLDAVVDVQEDGGSVDEVARTRVAQADALRLRLIADLVESKGPAELDRIRAGVVELRQAEWQTLGERQVAEIVLDQVTEVLDGDR